MKLISCYIEHFGKLQQFRYSFQSGLNIIQEENGWGKSTFSAFLKAMLYGLEYKQGKTVTDRRRYFPWTKGKFGGYLIFEIEGKQYKIERFFGEKEKEDSCIIYDLATNQATEMFSGNLGEELWKVDRESFENTAFITLLDSELLNDIIAGKLGNIDDTEADMDASGKAIEKLDLAMTKIKAKKGKGGLIGENTEQMNQLKQNLKEGKDAIIRIEQIETNIDEEMLKIKHINIGLEELDKEQEKLLLYEKKKQYLEIKDAYERKEKEVNILSAFFKGNIPLTEELEELSRVANNYENQKKLVEENRFSPEQEEKFDGLSVQFQKKTPTIAEIEACSSHITNLSNLHTQKKSLIANGETEAEYAHLVKKYGQQNIGKEKIDGYLEDYSEVATIQIEEQVLLANLTELDAQIRTQEEENKNSKSMRLLIFGLGISIIGILIAIKLFIPGIALILIGQLLNLVIYLSRRKPNNLEQQKQLEEKKIALKSKLKNLEHKRNQLENGYLLFIQKMGEDSQQVVTSLSNMKVEVLNYYRQTKERDERQSQLLQLEKKIVDLKSSIDEFFAQFFTKFPLLDYEKSLFILRKSSLEYEELNAKRQRWQLGKSQVEREHQRLERVLNLYYEEFPAQPHVAVEELKDQKLRLELEEIQFREITTRLQLFQKENQVEELEQVVFSEGEEWEYKEIILSKKRALTEEKEQVLRRKNNDEKDIQNLSIKADKVEDIESLISKLEEDNRELLTQYFLLDTAKQCMEKAKESLASKYMSEMSKAFKYYLGEIDTQKIDAYQIDIKLNVQIEQNGEIHNSSELSKGMKDLLQICMRMALVEAVYKDVERPILILDDPFVNLDNARLNNATELLKKIGKDYQMVYFICHDSRNVVR